MTRVLAQHIPIGARITVPGMGGGVYTVERVRVNGNGSVSVRVVGTNKYGDEFSAGLLYKVGERVEIEESGE